MELGTRATTRAGPAADRGLELTARREANRSLRRDANLLAGADVRAHTGGTLAAAESAEAGQSHVLPGRDLLLDRFQRGVDDLGHLAAAVTLGLRRHLIDQAGFAVAATTAGTAVPILVGHGEHLLFSRGLADAAHVSRTPIIHPMSSPP